MKNPMRKLFAVAVVMGATVGAAGADVPRTLASGRPACGNTMGKNGPRSECQWQRALDEARAYLAAAEHELRIAENLVASDSRREAALTVAHDQVKVQRAALARMTQDYERWKAQEKAIASR